MSESFRKSLHAGTRYCAVLGHPIRHSASPAMHNAALAELGLDWRYLAFDVRPEELGAALQGAKAMRFIGLNLTVPHKLLALEMVDELDESARTWGAVNTIRFEGRGPDGLWTPLSRWEQDLPAEIRSHGFNTDAAGLGRSLTEDLGLRLAGATVLLLGAGGAGRSAALKLASEKVGQLFLVNRTEAKARELAEEVQKRYPGVKVTVGYADQQVDLLLNATSHGLKPGDGLPFEEQKLSLTSCRAVYDMIYRPAETPLLRTARAAGCQTANGLGMLLHQGAEALEIWTGKPVPRQTMLAALRKNIYEP